eukprot:732419-Rhodomonas_salina.1
MTSWVLPVLLPAVLMSGVVFADVVRPRCCSSAGGGVITAPRQVRDPLLQVRRIDRRVKPAGTHLCIDDLDVDNTSALVPNRS